MSITKLIKEICQRLHDNIKVLGTICLLSITNTLHAPKESLAPLMELLGLALNDITTIDN